jgi:hypothetical protein
MRIAVAPVLALTGLMIVGGNAAAKPVRLAIDAPNHAFTAPVAGAGVSNVIFLERCAGGCSVTKADKNDARALTSSILPNSGTFNITEFEDASGAKGSVADAEWAMLVSCVRDVYSPFAVEVTDVKPASGTYHLAIVAGNPQEVGLANNVLGVAPLTGNCAAVDNAISFSFANAHPQTDPTQHMLNVCWTVAQESAHAYGLDHEFEFVSGRSACNDPMTYRNDCGGQKFYRNFYARCGEEVVRECRCTSTQNSHKTLLQLFGAGTPTSGAPSLQVTTPSLGGGPLPANVIAIASAKRGIARMQLFLNGFPMFEISGAEFGGAGQPESTYGLLPPPTMPDSIYDLFVRASDDLGIATDSIPVTVTKGEPCVSADTCLANQKCEAGRCFWEASVGEIGDECTFPQFCKSLQCRGTADLQICTQTCVAEDPDGCPSGMSCSSGVCFFVDGGCCSASPGGWMPAGLLAFIVLLGLSRRRK